MAMTSRKSSSPTRRNRKLVWTNYTSYPGASGLHSEVSRRSHSIDVTGQHELQAHLAFLRSTHQKELRRLHRQRKLLQTSMLAYAQKMKEISDERASTVSPSAVQDSPSPPAGLTFTTQHQNGSSSAESSDSSRRNSIGSGDQSPEALAQKSDRLKIHRASLPTLKLSPHISVRTPQPVSAYRTIGKISTEDNTERREMVRRAESRHTSNKPQPRRHSIAAKPDIITLRIIGEEESSTDVRRSSSPLLAISQFPEYMFKEEESSDEADFSEEKRQVSPKPKQSSPRQKAKESYWGSKKAKPKHKVVITKAKPASTPSPRRITPRRPAPKPKQKQKTFLQPPKGPYIHAFRYSEAVDDIVQDFDECKPDMIHRRTVRRASETLPALDLLDLRHAVERQREQSRRNSVMENRESEHYDLAWPDHHNDNDLTGDDDISGANLRTVSAAEASTPAAEATVTADDESSAEDADLDNDADNDSEF